MAGPHERPGHTGRRQSTGRARLSRSADFDRVYRDGRSYASRFLVVHVFPRTRDGASRLGLSVGRRVGGAVERNRVKRLLREAFDAVAHELPPGHDFVIVARPDVRRLAEERGEAGVEEALRELVASTALRQDFGRTA